MSCASRLGWQSSQALSSPALPAAQGQQGHAWSPCLRWPPDLKKWESGERDGDAAGCGQGGHLGDGVEEVGHVRQQRRLLGDGVQPALVAVTCTAAATANRLGGVRCRGFIGRFWGVCDSSCGHASASTGWLTSSMLAASCHDHTSVPGSLAHRPAGRRAGRLADTGARSDGPHPTGRLGRAPTACALLCTQANTRRAAQHAALPPCAVAARGAASRAAVCVVGRTVVGC